MNMNSILDDARSVAKSLDPAAAQRFARDVRALAADVSKIAAAKRTPSPARFDPKTLLDLLGKSRRMDPFEYGFRSRRDLVAHVRYAVTAILSESTCSVRDLAKLMGTDVDAIRVDLSRARVCGYIRTETRGPWLATKPTDKAVTLVTNMLGVQRA